jgi:parallel beta-helix repeat protein
VNKNWLSSAFLLSIMISGFVIAGITRFSTVQAATNVGGVISSDTVWTLTNSPYIFAGDVTIAPGVTLLIEPGVTIDFNSWSLIVEGTLYARGNENSRLKFQSSEKIVGAWPPRIYFNDTSTWWNVNTGTGCIIEYAEINVSNFQYETIMGGYPKISNNLIFNYGNDAAAVRTNGLVINNTILGGWYGVVAENGTILQNTVKDTDGGGILCGYISTDPIYHPTIIGNLVANNSVGIYVSSCSPYIANNTIVNNTRGIRFDYYAFSRNAVPAGIIYNNLDGNDYAVFVEYEDPQISIDMTYNWWGTTDASFIDQKIYDQKDNSGLSLVNYAPFLTAPAILLPDLIPLPTPSPSPSPSPSSSPSPSLTPTPTPVLTQISISVDVLSAAVGTAVNVNGILVDANGNPLQDKSVTLSYAVADSSSWVPMGSGTTNAAGEYNIQWVNTASGTFTLKAEWNGNAEYFGASATATLSFLPYDNHQDFILESNSTVSALAFNSTSLELSFTVDGTSETAGYVKVTIAKSIVANAENIKVSLDGNQLNYEITSNANAWLLTFTYMHSTHQVRISLAANAATATLLGLEFWIGLGAVIIIVVIGACLLLYSKKRKR